MRMQFGPMCRATWPVLAAILAATPLAQGAEAWQIGIPAAIRPALSRALAARLDEVVDRNTIREKLGIPDPPEEPSKPLDQVSKEAQAAIEEAGGANAHERALEKIRQEAEERYGTFVVGNTIRVETVRGRVYEGLLLRVVAGKAQISNYWVSFRDLDEISRLRFSPEQSKERRERLIRAKTRLLEDQGGAAPSAEDQEAATEVYRKYGYVNLQGKWLTQSDALDQAVAYMRKRFAQRLGPDVIKEIMTACDYTLTPKGWTGNGSLLPAVRFCVTGIEGFRDGIQDNGSITAWSWHGPHDGSEWEDHGLATVYAPERGTDKEEEWKPVPPEAVSAEGAVDLKKVAGPITEAALYLRTFVWSPKAIAMRLDIGSDDGVKAWVNRRVVHERQVERPLKVGNDKVEAHLWRGWNEILLKISQGTGDFGGALRIVWPKGGVPMFLSARADPPAVPEAYGSSVTDDAGFLTTWQMSGPYTAGAANVKALIERRFAPETGQDAPWAMVGAVSLPAGGNRAYWVNLGQEIGGDHRAAYLASRIWSPDGRWVSLELGSDDGMKVWLNGKVVITRTENRGCVPGDDKVNVRLRPGWNDLQAKVATAIGDWGFCAKLVSADNEPIGDLRVAPEVTRSIQMAPDL